MSAEAVEKTLIDEGTSLLEVKGSKFYGLAYPVSTREEIDRILKEVCRRFPDATHIVYSFRLGEGGRYEYFTDDGEPSGTAGASIIRIMKGRNISNALVIVVRYFGGTKLGTGGLARAYSETASVAILNAKTKPLVRMTKISAKIPYGTVSRLTIMIDRTGGVVLSQQFDRQVVITAKVPDDAVARVESFVAEVTHGTEKVRIIE